MGAIASQITSRTIVYSTVNSDADQRKHQSSASLAFVRGIHLWPVISTHKWPVTRKLFPFDDVIMFDEFQSPSPLCPCRSLQFSYSSPYLYMRTYLFVFCLFICFLFSLLLELMLYNLYIDLSMLLNDFSKTTKRVSFSKHHRCDIFRVDNFSHFTSLYRPTQNFYPFIIQGLVTIILHFAWNFFYSGSTVERSDPYVHTLPWLTKAKSRMPQSSFSYTFCFHG